MQDRQSKKTNWTKIWVWHALATVAAPFIFLGLAWLFLKVWQFVELVGG